MSLLSITQEAVGGEKWNDRASQVWLNDPKLRNSFPRRRMMAKVYHRLISLSTAWAWRGKDSVRRIQGNSGSRHKKWLYISIWRTSEGSDSHSGFHQIHMERHYSSLHSLPPSLFRQGNAHSLVFSTCTGVLLSAMLDNKASFLFIYLSIYLFNEVCTKISQGYLRKDRFLLCFASEILNVPPQKSQLSPWLWLTSNVK